MIRQIQGGHTNIGWLDSYHSFSFGEYHNPERMGFGALRVINDDTIKPGTGFGKHSHKNMEIITIMLEGELLHEDDFNSKALLKKGDVQAISAGKGIVHSTTNPDDNLNSELLQIWITPNELNVTPLYRSSSIDSKECQNKFQQIISLFKTGAGLWIYQNVWFSIATLDINTIASYSVNDNKNGFTFSLCKEVQC